METDIILMGLELIEIINAILKFDCKEQINTNMQLETLIWNDFIDENQNVGKHHNKMNRKSFEF